MNDAAVDSSPRPSRPSRPSISSMMRPVRTDPSIASRSDVGRARDNNEDTVMTGSSREVDVLAIVCDGMGGSAAGEVASAMTAKLVHDAILEGERPDTSIGRRLIDALELASQTVFDRGLHDQEWAGMGTTATACALQGSSLYLAQVGDSRAYLLRDGELAQLTRDQTLVNLLVERGQLTAEEAKTFEHRNVILQAVGSQPRIEVDLREVKVGKGDMILVCSDGLHGVLDDEEIREYMLAASSTEEACDLLIDAANEAGGPDNVSCIIFVVGGAEPVQGAPAVNRPIVEPPPLRASSPAHASPAPPPPVAKPGLAGLLGRLAAALRRHRR